MITVVALLAACSGCAPWVRPVDNLAACLDRCPCRALGFACFDEPGRCGSPVASGHDVAGGANARGAVRLAQHGELIPSPTADAESTPAGRVEPPLVPEFPGDFVGPLLGPASPVSGTPAGNSAAAEPAVMATSGAPVDCGCMVGESCPSCFAGSLLDGGFCLKDHPLLQPPPHYGPPVRHQPELPPPFLTVPTVPVVAPGRTGPPELARGHVERGYRPELTVTGGY